MRDLSYLGIVILLTTAILVGLFFYNKGTIEEITGTLALSGNIDLNFERVATKPSESNRNYVIFYVNTINNSSDSATLRIDPPIDPCSKYNSSYNYYQTPNPSQTTYQQCLSSTEYKDYQQKDKDYEASYTNGNLELMTPQNQKCNLNDNYQINNKYPNIGYNLSSYTFQANEKKIGSIVFDCSEKEGKFTIKYRSSSLDINI